MTNTAIFVGTLGLAYLLGSVPFGFLGAKAKGVDIRAVGSGNIGATNVFRSIGKGWGLFTFLCDFLKGLLPVLLLPLLANRLGFTASQDGLRLLGGIGAIAGHNWPVFLRFRGGKGVATSTGAVLAIAPAAVGTGLVVWILCFLLSRYVSLASIAAAVTIAVGAWVAGPVCSQASPLVPSVLTVMALLIVLRHHANIRRLLAGTENRFTFKKDGAS